jgi:hypothetical protein
MGPRGRPMAFEPLAPQALPADEAAGIDKATPVPAVAPTGNHTAGDGIPWV